MKKISMELYIQEIGFLYKMRNAVVVQLCIQKLNGSNFEFKCKGSAYNLTFIMDGGVLLVANLVDGSAKRIWTFTFNSEEKLYNKSLLNLENIKDFLPLQEGEQTAVRGINTGERYGGSGRIYLDTIIIRK